MLHLFTNRKPKTNCHLYKFETAEEIVSIWYGTRNYNFALLFKILHNYRSGRYFLDEDVIEMI